MKVEAYISSGILESYVLGILSMEESREVEEMMATHASIRSEIALIEATLESLAATMATPPNLKTKEAILGQLEPSTPEVDKPLQSRFWTFATAASLLLAMGASLIAYLYWSKWQLAEEELVALGAKNQVIADNYSKVNQRLDQLQETMIIINDPSFARIPLSGTDNAPKAEGTIYWDQSTKEVYLSIQQLKALSSEEQYQLWAIIDGVPQDAGIFDFTENFFAQMKDIGPQAEAFAITIEPRGGSARPTLETMQLLGKLS